MSDFTLYSGAHSGAEAEFGRCAERWGINEVNFSFEGHVMERNKNIKMLSDHDLQMGDVSMEIVSKRMGRFFGNAEKIRRVLQSIFHIVNNGHDIFAVGLILPDNTVKGGTGWGIELGKFFNRPTHVYDQEQKAWFSWINGEWVASTPTVQSKSFAGLGTRFLNDDGRQAIAELFQRSFGDPSN